MYRAYVTANLQTERTSPPTGDDIRPGLIIVILAAAGIVVSLAQTLVVPIIGILPQIFDTTATDAS